MAIKTILPAVASASLLFGGAAYAAPVTGGTTVLDVDVDTDLDVDVDVRQVGGDEAEDGLFTFDITGGDVDLDALTGSLVHADAAFEIAANSRFVTVTNLIIDFNQSVVFGDIQMGSLGDVLGTNVAMFDFDISEIGDISELFDLTDPSLGLFATAEFSAIFAAAFVVEIDIVGILFGNVGTNPMTGVDNDVIPLPGAAILFGTVMAGAAARRKLTA